MLLSNERVKRGLSLQEVADRLKLSRKQLEAIENDEYDKLPGPAFARGFVRNYAKLLGLDVALLNASLDAHLPMPPVNPPVADTAPAAPAPAASSRSPAVNPTTGSAGAAAGGRRGLSPAYPGRQHPGHAATGHARRGKRLAAGRAES